MKFIKILVLIVIIVLVGWFYLDNAINSPSGKSGQKKTINIKPGEKIFDIGKKLEQENLINSRFIFDKYIRYFRKGISLKAGEYVIGPDESMTSIIEKLSAGKTVSNESSIKIIEGWNIKDINNYLIKNNLIKTEDFLPIVQGLIVDFVSKNNQAKYSFINDLPAKATFEGFLFPDTYRIYKDASAAEMIAKMLANFDKKITPQMRADIAKQKKNLLDVIIMASLIEKEAKIDVSGKSGNNDARTVSGIFWNRIKIGQALESCATLAYILGENKPQYSVEDTNVESPYNTYKYRGLPAGPICNPGLEAIKAAIYPIDSDYNYFLNSPDESKTIFSRTYEEHLRNKAKYLR